MPLPDPNHYAGYVPPVQPPPQDYPQTALTKTPGSEGTQSVIQPEGEASQQDDRQNPHSL